MSFSGKVREELSENISQARHCRIAELAAFIGMCGTVSIDSFDRYHIKIHSENIVVARKVFTLLKKTFNIRTEEKCKKRECIISCRDKKSRGCAQSPSGNEDDRRTAGGNGCDLRI